MPFSFPSRPLVGVVLAALLVTGGCSTLSHVNPWSEEEAPPLVIEVAGDSLMNNGNAANVVFYQLTNNANFQRAPIETFWKNDRQTLADELVGNRQQVFLYPGQAKQVELDLKKQTRYLGVAANLRQPEPGQWRRSFPIQEIDGHHMAIQVEPRRLTVSMQESESHTD